MKLKNMWKRFWTLDVHNHEGFTLVELIIVIAILAILSTGAIAGYSAYVEKANKTADQAMIAEIENVLAMHYYANGIGNGGYVALPLDDVATAEGDAVIKALEDAYGTNWANALKLKYADWGFTSYFDGMTAAEIATIAGSSYMKVSTDGLLGAVTNLTGAATTVIKDYADKGNDVSGKLSNLLGDEFVEKLEATGVKPEDDDYETVVSNLMVGHFANQFSGMSAEDAASDDLTGMVLLYASLAAYSETYDQEEQMALINQHIASSDNMDALSASQLLEYIDNNASADFKDGFESYYAENAEKDNEAVLEMMGAVSNVAGNITDRESLSNANLFETEAISSQMNGYMTAVKALAAMGIDPNSLPDNALIVFIDNEGNVETLGMN